MVSSSDLASNGVYTNSTLGHSYLRGWHTPLHWITEMVVFVAYTILRQSLTNRCDYLINIRAKRGEVGEGWKELAVVDYILTVLEGSRVPL